MRYIERALGAAIGVYLGAMGWTVFRDAVLGREPWGDR